VFDDGNAKARMKGCWPRCRMMSNDNWVTTSLGKEEKDEMETRAHMYDVSREEALCARRNVGKKRGRYTLVNRRLLFGHCLTHDSLGLMDKSSFNHFYLMDERK
jgi:hypothetical protein